MAIRRQRNRTIYTGLVGAKMPPFKLRISRAKPKRIKLVTHGGPLDEANGGPGYVLVEDQSGPANTFVFTHKGQTGRYVAGQWVPVNPR